MKYKLKSFLKYILHKLFVNFQKFGLDILPRHFYSEIPNIKNLESTNYWKLPFNMDYINGSEIKSQIKNMDFIMDKKIVKEIKKFCGINFKSAPNKFSELAAHDAIVNFSGSLNSCALGPDPKNLISLDIFISATAHEFSDPEKLTIAS